MVLTRGCAGGGVTVGGFIRGGRARAAARRSAARDLLQVGPGSSFRLSMCVVVAGEDDPLLAGRPRLPLDVELGILHSGGLPGPWRSSAAGTRGAA